MTETNEEQVVTREVDIVLETMVSVVEANGMSFGVTLSVGGSIVSGRLVGRTHWLNSWDVAMKAQGGEQLGAMTGALRDSLVSDDPADDDERVETYIHLQDAYYVFRGGDLAPEVGMFWRGRLESVDGWSLGSFTSS